MASLRELRNARQSARPRLKKTDVAWCGRSTGRIDCDSAARFPAHGIEECAASAAGEKSRLSRPGNIGTRAHR